MNEQEPQVQTSQYEEEKPFSFGLGASTFLAAGAVDALAHLGPTGLVVGGLAAYVAGKHGAEMTAWVKELFPPSAPLPQELPPRRGGRSMLDRAFGRFPDEPAPEEGRGEEVIALPERSHLREKTKYLLHLAPDLVLPASDLAGKAIFIAGVRRSGKTTLGVRIAEQMSTHRQPLFVPDLEGDWISAAETTFRNGRILAHPSSARRYTDVKDFVPVSVEDADVAGFNILDDGCQAVLDMTSYPSIDEACAVVIGIIKGLFQWAEQYEDERVLCHVYLDEAQRFLPQALEDSIVEDKAVRQALLKAYMDVIAVGGKRGLSPVILTQRFSQVNKKIMAQSEVFFLLRQTMDNDLKRCMEYVNTKTAMPEHISQFAQGQGVYIAASGEQLVTRFLPRESDGKRGATPTVEAAERYALPKAARKRTRPPTQREKEQDEVQMEYERLLAQIKDGGLDQLLAVLQEVQSSRAALPVSPPPPPTPARLPIQLQKALDLYQSGVTSYRDLGEALDIGKDKAGELIKDLKKRGLIALDENK